MQRFNDCSLPRIPFQNEKDFTVQVKINRQNNRVYSKDWEYDVEPRWLFNEGNKFPVKLMVSTGITL